MTQRKQREGDKEKRNIWTVLGMTEVLTLQKAKRYQDDTMNKLYANEFESRRNLQILEKLTRTDIKPE